MKINIEDTFKKDVDLISEKVVLNKLKDKINEIFKASNLHDVSNLRKLKGHKYYYRIRIGNYRIGLSYLNEEINLIRFLNRKDIYRYFPKKN